MDEPFGALHAQVGRELRRWLREIHDRTGHTTVFVTHDQEEALKLADRVVVTSQGKIELGGAQHRVEIELPVDHPAAERSRIAFRPNRWEVFPTDAAKTA